MYFDTGYHATGYHATPYHLRGPIDDVVEQGGGSGGAGRRHVIVEPAPRLPETDRHTRLKRLALIAIAIIEHTQ